MQRFLGRGNFAKVFKARNIATGESVAVKVMNKEQLMKTEGLAEHVEREISVMHRIKHPNVVELKEVMATKSKIFFVMEYVRGGELFAKVEKGKLDEDVARKYFQQLISAIDYCHSRGVSHRDLKPENLLLDENGNLKVSDFGLSALPEQIWNDGLLHTQCGTPAYVAPEVLRKKGYDGAKADIWSCGVILFVLLSGYLPFLHENLMKMYVKIFKADYKFPAWISKDARVLISRHLVVDPRRRITIPEIMENPWFKQGLQKPVTVPAAFPEEEEGGGSSSASSPHSPPFFNAFDLISSMSSGFDLSNLFEEKKKPGSMFTTKCAAPVIMSKLETVAKESNFRVVSDEDYKVKIQGKAEGRKGVLAVTAEVYSVAPEVAVVEFSKRSGDTLEYDRFCEEEVKPALKDVVWTWQGESSDDESSRHF
ncbi:CBL-interacting serine/threonine-protein kinase 5 [Linum grandiflorum]